MKHKKQIQNVGKWMRLHVILTAILFSLYFLAAFLYSPHFFLADIKDKIHALADTVVVTAKVLDVPVQPVVSATAVCDSGNLYVALDWPTDENSYTYDVFRDGSMLVSNLTASSYQDSMVAIGTSYEYYIVAYGPMGPGFATSDTVSMITITACVLDGVGLSDSSASDDNDSSRHKKKSHSSVIKESVIGGSSYASIASFEFALDIANGERGIFQGERIDSEIRITRMDASYSSDPVEIRYSIIDSDGVMVFYVDKKIDHADKDQSVFESIPLPADLRQGSYILQAKLTFGRSNAVRKKDFFIKELPLLDLGSGSVITYPQLVRNIGWVAFISLFSMSSWSLLWIREYWLYLHAKQHIAERNLSGKSFISKRKGVSR